MEPEAKSGEEDLKQQRTNLCIAIGVLAGACCVFAWYMNFFAWFLVAPILLVTFILSIILIAKGGIVEGVLGLLGTLVVVPVIVAVISLASLADTVSDIESPATTTEGGEEANADTALALIDKSLSNIDETIAKIAAQRAEYEHAIEKAAGGSYGERGEEISALIKRVFVLYDEIEEGNDEITKGLDAVRKDILSGENDPTVWNRLATILEATVAVSTKTDKANEYRKTIQKKFAESEEQLERERVEAQKAKEREGLLERSRALREKAEESLPAR